MQVNEGEAAARHAAATAAASGGQAGPGERVAALAAVAGDVPVLLRELRRRLRAARLRSANLEAAGRAALSAARDGERDPLWYLRDEIGDPSRGEPGDGFRDGGFGGR